LWANKARIIVTTLQKFPFIFDKIGALPERSYAVIVDEAHSSQTGDTAKELRRALGSVETEIDSGATSDSEDDDGEPTDAETLLAEAVAARGHQPNLSFFAFTATPKGRTLELFGEVGGGNRHEPFHLYPMRQAIEEGFICDVLAGYITYNRYYHLEKAILDDPSYDTDKARSALARFVTLHPDNLTQKAEIIVEHFRTKIAHHLSGKAKAMVVCSSRPHAVRMWQALRSYTDKLGYGLGVLVAFSGEVEGLTESKANGFGESQTAERFDSEAWQMMVVAEKFQTGFDQPKLAAMYVDKTLTGLAAVQTLSRLNRIHPDKSATYVIDFVNDADQIREAFAVYHGRTVAPPTDPNLLFDTRNDLDAYGVLDTGEIARTLALLVAEGTHDQAHAALEPAVDRFKDLSNDDRDAFRDALGRFVRVYGFLSLVVPFRNPGLERDYLYCRALAALIRDGNAGASISLGAEVELTHLRHELTFEGSIELPGGEGAVTTIFSGTGPTADPEQERLSEIIARINERFGTDWTEEDRLVFEAAAGDLVGDTEIQSQAVNNDETTFRDHVFPERYLKALLSRRDRNSDLIYSYLDNDELQAQVMDIFAVEVQRRATVARQRTCPIGDLLGPDRESPFLEYKSTLRWDVNQQRKGGAVEDAAIKTIAGFANSDFGGTLLIGVADDGSVHGLEDDYATFSKRGQRGDQDLWGQHLQNLIRSRLGDAAMSLVTWEFHTINGNHLARVSVAPASHPVQDRRDGQDTFWLRTPTSTIPITDPKDRDQVIARRWGTTAPP
jgi:type I restriction enzyme R subunit